VVRVSYDGADPDGGVFNDALVEQPAPPPAAPPLPVVRTA
jgi:hypothetical protein